MNIGTVIMNKRKYLGLTQQALANELNVSFQAISKWENGTSCPDIDLLPAIASVLQTSVDSLLGYRSMVAADYEDRYKEDGFFWGVNPNYLCYELMHPLSLSRFWMWVAERERMQYFLRKTVISLLLLTWQNPGWKREGCWQKRMAPM